MNYNGVIIEESLENKEILKEVKVLSTRIESVTEKHKTPWVKQWTMHKVEIEEDKAADIADKISRALDSKHSWYADFKDENTHFIIFHDKVFRVDTKNREQYEEAKEYGLSLGIPDYQLDFSPFIKKWER